MNTPACTTQPIENWPIERLVEYPRNQRKYDKAVTGWGFRTHGSHQ